MKEYFKHKYGYLNIDSENIYFTKSGNWGEARDLIEKKIDPTPKPTNNQKVVGYIFAVLFIAINILGLIGLIESFVSLISIFIIIGWFVYQIISKKLKPFKPNFLIPIIKIQKLEIIDESQIKFTYRDGDNIKAIQLLKINPNNSVNVINTLESIIKT